MGPSIVWIGAGVLRDPGSGEEPEPRGRGGPLSGPARVVRAAALSRYERARAGASVSECPRVQCTVAECRRVHCHRVHCHRNSTSGYRGFEPADLVPVPVRTRSNSARPPRLIHELNPSTLCPRLNSEPTVAHTTHVALTRSSFLTSLTSSRKAISTFTPSAAEHSMNGAPRDLARSRPSSWPTWRRRARSHCGGVSDVSDTIIQYIDL